MNGLGAAANSYYGQAANQSGLGAAAVNPTAVNGAAISQYESPYQQDVINATMAQIDQQNKIQQNQQTSNAIGAGAFGGDRAGLASAALAGQQALATNSTLANLNNQNYAAGAWRSEHTAGKSVSARRRQTARRFNRMPRRWRASDRPQLARALVWRMPSLAPARSSSRRSRPVIRRNTGNSSRRSAYPFQTEQYLANIVGEVSRRTMGRRPMGQTTTQTSPLNSILGLRPRRGGAGAWGQFDRQWPLKPWVRARRHCSVISDQSGMKESIRKIGKSFDGQPIYAFRYKGRFRRPDAPRDDGARGRAQAPRCDRQARRS